MPSTLFFLAERHVAAGPGHLGCRIAAASSCATISSRARGQRGSRIENTPAAAMQTNAPMATVSGAPMRSASQRRTARRMAPCHEHHRVDRHDAAAQRVGHHRLNQRIGRRHLHHHRRADRDEQRGDSQNVRDAEKPISATPKVADAVATHRPSPRTPLRRTSDSAPASAPSPDAPIKRPRPLAPPWRIDSANTGISTEYGMPAKLMTPSRMSSARTGAVRATKRKPSAVSRQASVARRDAAARRLHHQQPRDDRDVAEAVQQEAPALADRRHEHAGDRRPDDARAVHHR